MGRGMDCTRYCPDCGARCMGGHAEDSDAHVCGNGHQWGSFDE